jgi:hypothetical protein
LKHVVKHGLGQELTQKAARAAWNEYHIRFSKYKPILRQNIENKGSVEFEVKGKKYQVGFELRPGGIVLEMDVPFYLLPFKNLAISAIENEIERWIVKANAGQL